MVFQPGMTVVTGKNGAGKSSLIDAVFYALKPEGVSMPIHESANRCVIKLSIGDSTKGYIIERTVTESGKYLKVTGSDGKSMASPQTFLNSLFGEMVDPEAFLRMKPRDQCDALRLACNCDTRALDMSYKQLFDARTAVNRQLDQDEKALNEIGDVKMPIEAKSAAGITTQLNAAHEIIRIFDGYVSKAKTLKDEIETIKPSLQKLSDQILKLQGELSDAKMEILSREDQIARLREKVVEIKDDYKQANSDVGSLGAEMQTIDEHNKLAVEIEASNKWREKMMESRNKNHTEVVRLNDEMEAIKLEKKTLLELADYPVEGMIVEGDSIFVNDIPFNDVNTAERIKIATHVAMAQNPALKMIIVRNGSMLDEESLAVIQEVASERDYQIIVEKVSSKQENGSLHIVEGRIQK